MEKTKQSRRSFIGALATTGAGVALASIPASAHLKFDSDMPGIDMSADTALEAEKWLKNLQGKKFPVVYDMHEHKDFWAGIWTNIYLATNTGVSDLGVAIVMRHGGFPFALSNEMWAKYKLGEFFKITDKNADAPSLHNMYLDPTGKDYPLPGLDGIIGLQKKGVAFCVCNMALKVYGGAVAQAKGLSADDVYNDFVKNVLPGIQLVPAGVWALGRMQQAPLSYGYINAG